MRSLILILIIVLYSCGTDDNDFFDIPCTEEDCVILNPLSFSVTPSKESLTINFGLSYIVDGASKVCFPDRLDFYYSEINGAFNQVIRAEPFDETLSIGGLIDGKEYFIKMVNKHCELDSFVAPIQSVIVGEISPPELIDNLGKNFKEFRLAKDGNQFIYRSHSNNWHLSSLSNPEDDVKIIENAYYTQWNSNSKISFVQNTRIEVRPNLEGITSKSLNCLDLDSKTVTVLHEIEHLQDFNNDVYSPEQYRIREFHISLDGNSLYFISNKDNGSSNNKEKQVFDNIWKLDLTTGNIEALSDFLPIQFDLRDIIEDPLNNENFYVVGRTYITTVETEGTVRFDIHYFNSSDKSITPIYLSNYSENHVDIDPHGNNLVFVSNRTGKDEIWSYNFNTKKVKQITNSTTYFPTNKWKSINWISDTKFMTYIEQDRKYKFATFTID